MAAGEDLLAWVKLTRIPALDTTTLANALDAFGSAVEIVTATDAALESAGLPDKLRIALALTKRAASSAESQWLCQPKHHLVPFTDPNFPALLRATATCPIALYVAGDPRVLNDPQLAMVGARNPTPQGRETAFDFAERLAERGLAITSGLADGVDSAAHRGALAAQGITVAVLGTGIDVIYPRGNRALSVEIETVGALVSEFPLGTPPRRENFPQRNRIIAALSLGTLVVEAARRSGSLITARLAGDHGRELFAIPGSIHNPLSRGCHELIRQGAKLTETIDDILSELNFSAFFSLTKEAPAVALHAAGMDKEHKILLDALGFDPADLDALVVRTGFKPEAVSSMMLILELEGHVQAAPGGRYSRVVRSRR
jgi:DNA processing protein